MKLLEEKILEKGNALSETVLKVDSFLNYQVDPDLMKEIGKTFAEHYKDKGITKVFTIESSGISPAVFTAAELKVPMVILKKQTTKIMDGEILHTNITSFTKGIRYDLTVAKKFIDSSDNILIIDDFLANGEASTGAADLIKQGGGHVAGIGIVIEKSFQKGRQRLEDAGYQVCSLARISKLAKGIIEFTSADL